MPKAPIPPPETQATVLVVDDDPSARRGFARLLRAAGYAVEVFGSAREYLERLPAEGCGCLVLDVRMPELSGLDLQEELTGAGHTLPIIFVTGHGDIPMSVMAMKKGATDFLTKPIDEHGLLAAVRHAVARHREVRAALAEAAAARSLLASLTPRERNVMDLVVAGRLNKQIAFELDISEATVKVHRGRVMRKLRVRSVADLVRVVQRAGGSPHTTKS